MKRYLCSLALMLGWPGLPAVTWAVPAASTQPLNETAAVDPCEEALGFRPKRGTLEYFIEQTRRDQRHEDVLPKFVNPQRETELAINKWRGVKGPRILQDLLPDDCRFIDHKLLGSAGDGIVKDAGSGEFVMLRCGMMWSGQWVGFNISVPVSALVANIGRKERWLIGEEIEGIVDWGHGGGTKTTGNHTSIGLMGHLIKYGIATIAIDQPWHGEGPRNFFKDDVDYWAFRLALLDKFAHPSVMAVGVGHSMGGIFADMMMRRSDLRHLNLSRRYKGFVPLSAVVDLMPGRSLREKNQAERWKEAENRTEALQHRIAPGDRNLGTALLEQDKVSALSGVFVNFMNMFHDWKAPAHNGDQYLPALFIWGDSDYLYVGNEDLIDKYLLNLKNVRLKVYGPRITFKGDVVQVGHLIFDHHRLVYDPAEAKKLLAGYMTAKGIANIGDDDALRKAFFEKFIRGHVSQHFWLNEDNRGFAALMVAGYYWDKDFHSFVKIAMKESELYRKAFAKTFRPEDPKTLAFAEKAGERAYMLQFTQKDVPETYTLVREEVERVLGKKLEPRRKESATAVLANLLQTYSANLAFRKWLESADVYIESTTPDFQALNEMSEQIRKFIQARDKLDEARKEIEQAKKSNREVKPAAAANLANWTNQFEASGRILQERFKVDPMDPDALQAQVERISLLRQKAFVPPGDAAAKVRANIAKREQFNGEIQELRRKKEELRKQLDDLTKQRNSLETDLADIGRLGGAYEVNAAIRAAEAQLAALVAADEKVRLSVEKYMMEMIETQQVDADLMRKLPPEVLQVFDAYEQASKTYQAAAQHVRKATAIAAERGHLGSDAKEKYGRLLSLRREILRLSRQINEIDGRIFARTQLRNRMLQEWANQMVPGYLNIERKKLLDLMSVPPEQWGTIRGDLEAAWSEWKALWRERPPADKVELY